MKKGFLENRSAGFYILLVVAVMGFGALICYFFANKEPTSLVPLCYVLLIVDIAATVVQLTMRKSDLIMLFVPALFALTFVLVFTDNATKFMLAINGVAQNFGEMGGPTPVFWLCEALIAAAAVTSALGSFFSLNKSDKNTKKEKSI